MNILHIFTFATLISSLAACGQGNVEENVGLNVDTSVTESTGTSDSDVENVVSPSKHSGIVNTPFLMEGMTGVFLGQ